MQLGNIGEDLVQILESAMTGRMGLGAGEAVPEYDEDGKPALMKSKAGSLLEMEAQTEEEMEHMRNVRTVSICLRN